MCIVRINIFFLNTYIEGNERKQTSGRLKVMIHAKIDEKLLERLHAAVAQSSSMG